MLNSASSPLRSEEHTHSFSPWAKVAAGLALLFVLFVTIAGITIRLQGGRWYAVETPSMGRTAPVGTLLITEKVPYSSLKVGDFITFRPPGTHEIYSHRIVAKTPQGLETRGDINSSPDGWRLKPDAIVGKVAHRLWGMGLLLRALPYFFLGTAIIWCLSYLIRRPSLRSPFRFAGFFLVFGVTSYILHPWLGVEKLTSAPTAGGGAKLSVVSTGVLPISVQSPHGPETVLSNGGVGNIHIPKEDFHHNAFHIIPTLHLTLWSFILLAFLCLSPLIWTLLVGFAPRPEDELVGEQEDGVTP